MQTDFVFSPLSQHLIGEVKGALDATDSELREALELPASATVVRSPDGGSILVIDWEPA